MRASPTSKVSTTDLLTGSRSEAKSLFQKILDIKSLRLKILPISSHTPASATDLK
jgi:hypothetical protein